MTSSERPPRSADRAEGDPPEEDASTTGRTPRADDPAEGGDGAGDAAGKDGGNGADTPR